AAEVASERNCLPRSTSSTAAFGVQGPNGAVVREATRRSMVARVRYLARPPEAVARAAGLASPAGSATQRGTLTDKWKRAAIARTARSSRFSLCFCEQLL